MDHTRRLKLTLLSATFLTGAIIAAPAAAQTATAAPSATPDPNAPAAPHADEAQGPTQVASAPDQSNDIVVTATRRATTIQDTPINISAVSGDQLAAQRINDIRGLADFTPGITVNDTGPRTASTIVLRGLSASDTSNEGNNSDDALGVYLGEVPLYYDFKLLDLERTETLLGPQGTLYGLGTLAGAIRYIPKRPNTSEVQAEGHVRVYDKAHAEKVGFQGDFMINLPIVADHIAFRTASGYYFDPGFIDYPLLIQTPGTSLPQAGGTGNAIGPDYATNLRKEKDLNFEKTYTSRNQLLLQANPDLKAVITYAYQQTNTAGSQSNSAGVLGTGKYESGGRYKEPSRRSANLISGEINANLWDIADLVSTTAYTKVKNHSTSDNTDLLLDLDYDYEAFPAFSSYNDTRSQRTQLNQEVRLVSRHGGPLSWTLGGFYNRNKFRSYYYEVVPGLAQYYGTADTNPDEIEYASFTRTKVTEKAVYGEASLKLFQGWQVTGGIRYFKYTSEVQGALTLPLLDDDYDTPGYQQPPVSALDVDPAGGKTSKDGIVWKFNTSYKFTPDVMVYGTYSKGYRLGGPNRVAPCPDPVPANQQNACALPNEQQYGPDTTKNAELGIRAQLFDRKLSVNFDVYHIKWEGIQVDSATYYGVTGITVNGGSARSKGFEASFTAKPIPALTIQGTYSYVDAQLTSDVPGLIAYRTVPGFYGPYYNAITRPNAPRKFTQGDALAGDRLPGSAKNSGSIGATYTYPVGDAQLIANWTTTYRGNVVSRLGWDRYYGEKIPSYVTHRASLTYSTENYDLSLWSNNIFDKYAVTSIGQDLSRVGINDDVAVRYYSRSVLNPRTVGIEGRFKF